MFLNEAAGYGRKVRYHSLNSSISAVASYLGPNMTQKCGSSPLRYATTDMLRLEYVPFQWLLPQRTPRFQVNMYTWSAKSR